MKVLGFLIGALLAVYVSSSPLNEYQVNELEIEARGIIDQSINKTINDFLANLTDTIDVSSLPIDLGTGEVISGHLDLNNLKINGLKSLVATKISVNVLTLKLDINLKVTELLANLKYDADMLLLQLVPLYGDGSLSVTLDDIDIAITGKAKLTDGVDIKELAIALTLGDAVFDVTGLIDSSELSAIVSSALNDNFVKFINDNQEVITEVISPIIKDLINELLGKQSTLLSTLLESVDPLVVY